MGKRSSAWVAAMAMALGCHAAWAIDYRIPDEFAGSYLATRSAASCLRQQGVDQTSPVYLVVQSMQFRYGFLNPKDGNSLDAMVCRPTHLVLAVNGRMDVKSECFAIDKLVKKRFKFIKRDGLLLLQDVDLGTEEEFEVCY